MSISLISIFSLYILLLWLLHHQLVRYSYQRRSVSVCHSIYCFYILLVHRWFGIEREMLVWYADQISSLVWLGLSLGVGTLRCLSMSSCHPGYMASSCWLFRLVLEILCLFRLWGSCFRLLFFQMPLYQEVEMIDSIDGTKHRADVRLNIGLII